MAHPALPALAIPLRASVRLLATVLLMHGLAIVALIASPIATWLQLPAGVMVATSAARQISRFAGRGKALTELSSLAPGLLQIGFRDGTRLLGEVHSHTVVWPFAVFLVLRVDGRRAPLAFTLWNDASHAEDFRRLKMWLRALRWMPSGDGPSA